MACLFLIIPVLLQFTWADNATNKNVTLNRTMAVNVVARKLGTRQHGNHSYPFEFATFQNDNCTVFDKDKERLRTHKKNLQIAEKTFIAAGHASTGIGKLATWKAKPATSAIGELDFVGPFLMGTGFALGAAAAGIDVESRELEYTKCFKKEFDEFRNDFGVFKEKMNQEFSKVHKKLDKLEDQIQKGFDGVNLKLEEIRDELAMREYTKRIVEIRVLKLRARMYVEFAANGSRPELMQYCIQYDPSKVLLEIKELHVNTLEVKGSKDFTILRNRYIRMKLDLIDILEMEAVCFSTSALGGNKEAIRSNVNRVGAIFKEIMAQITGIASEAMNDIIDRVLPAKLHQFATCDAVTVIRKSPEFYNDLVEEHKWAEWAFIAGTTSALAYHFVAGEVKSVFVANHCGAFTDYSPLTFMWCDIYPDEKRKEVAGRFKEWLDKFDACCKYEVCDLTWWFRDNLGPAILNQMTRLPPSPNSPNVTFVSGLMLSGVQLTLYSSFISNPAKRHDYLTQGYLCNKKYIYHVCFA